MLETVARPSFERIYLYSDIEGNARIVIYYFWEKVARPTTKLFKH